MRHIRPALAVVLLLSAALSWWLVERQPPQRQIGRIERPPPGEVDYTLRGFEVVRMGPGGEPAHRLRAGQMRHFTGDDSTELAQPRLTVFQDGSPPWEIQSEQAWVSADGEQVLLTGEVQIDRAAGADRPPIRLTTRALRFRPGEDYAETDEKVRVVSGADWVDAVGMRAWLRPPSRLKFLSQVKGYYVPR